MKALIVVSVDLPNPDEAVTVLEHLDPPTIPYFDGEVRLVVGTDVADTIKFLDVG
jgi:hypothetical protein